MKKFNYYSQEMKMFWKMIEERHLIYKRKELEQLPPPWTHDPIFLEYKFTNIFRFLDRGTRIVTEHILTAPNHKPEDIIFNVILYRLFNKIETFMHHGMYKVGKYTKSALEGSLRALEATGNGSVFTNAFIVSGYSNSMFGNPSLDKISRLALIMEWMAPDIIESTPIIMNTDDMEVAYKEIISMRGLGPFLSYQISVDLSYWDKTKFDDKQFTVAGPGCKRGIDTIIADELKGKDYEDVIHWLRDHQFSFYKDYGINHIKLFDDQPFPVLSVMELENCLCEFQKYWKAKTNSGRPRNKYNDEDGYERYENKKDFEPWLKN
jgi:hypothetical protein